MKILIMMMVACALATEEVTQKSTEQNGTVTEKPRPKKDISADVRESRSLEYSYTLPHSHASFRSLNRRVITSPLDRNIKNNYYARQHSQRRTPAYAVQMEPMVQYSAKDPLYDVKAEIFEESLGKNEIHAQSKILSVKDDSSFVDNHVSETLYAGQHYGPPQQQYYEHPEPIIEIIIKESNESLPAPPQPVQPPPVKKEPIQVFYVKYKNDPHGYGKDSVIYEDPIPAITPPTNNHNDHDYYPTQAPQYLPLPPRPSTTLRTIIKPDSEVYHSNSGVRVTFGKEKHDHHSEDYIANAQEGYEGPEETAPQPAVAFPSQQRSSHQPHFQKRTPPVTEQTFQHAQQRAAQFQSPFPINHQELPHLNSPSLPFKAQPQLNRPLPPQHANKPQFPPQPQTQFNNQNFRPRPQVPDRRPPFHQGPQPQNFRFDEAKYLQDNYHTISADQFEPVKEQPLPIRPAQNFQQQPRPLTPQEEYNQRYYQQLRQQQQQQQQQQPQQRPPHQGPPTQFNAQPQRPQQQRPQPQFSQPQPHPQPQPQFSQPQPHPQPHPQPQPQPFPQQSQPQFPPQIQPFPQTQQQFHQQNIGSLIPNGGELVSSIPKFEQHITVSGPELQNHFPQFQQQPQAQQTQSIPQRAPQQRPQFPNNEFRQEIYQQFATNPSQPSQLQLEQIQKQQEEINRLQSQLLRTQQERQKYQTTPQPQPQPQQQSQQQYQEQQYFESFARTPASSTARPSFVPTSRPVAITPTTHRYVSSTRNSIIPQQQKKEEPKKIKSSVVLPDEVPDDLRQQLLSSGILDNADISVLDYDKIGDTPLDALPPDQLANFFSAGGAQQIASSELRPSIVKPNGEAVRASYNFEDQLPAASLDEYVKFDGGFGRREGVEMKVVHFDPNTVKGQEVADAYVKEDATRLDPVALNDHKYNRYLPLKVSGAQFPLPDAPELKGRKVSSVVVLAPVDYDSLDAVTENNRPERALQGDAKAIKFYAGETLTQLVKNPTSENYKIWLEQERHTEPEMQSVILLVTGAEDDETNKEIFMYDIASQTVSKLSGDLSSSFVEVAENNASSSDIDNIAIAQNGAIDAVASIQDKPPKHKNHKPTYSDVKDSKNKQLPKTESSKKKQSARISSRSDRIPIPEITDSAFNQVSISSGYSRMKLGRSL